MDISKIGDKDLYELFGLDFNCTSAEVRKAYRKKALECHPDKNPDNPNAGKLFNELTDALAILLDETARAAYDRLLQAKKAAKLRHKALDDRRKKFKADLESREEEYLLNKKKQKSDEEILRDEIKRLQKEGAKLLEEELKIVQEEVSKTMLEKNCENGSSYRIKAEWVFADGEGSPYTKEVLEKIFHKYGDLEALVVSEKKGKGKCIIEFKEKSAAELAIRLELGLLKCPLNLKWINKDLNRKSNKAAGSSDTLVTERDYESLVLRKMRQAEERRRLIEELQKEDAA